MNFKKMILIFIIVILIIGLGFVIMNRNKENIFKSQVSGHFYTGNKSALTTQLNKFYENIKIEDTPENIKAIIVPHAGYVYSGQTAMYAYKALYLNLLKSTQTEYKVIVLAPAHQMYFKGISVLSVENYALFNKKVSIVKSNNLNKYENDAAFLKEHSFETQLPFIDYIFSKANVAYKVLPILIGDVKEEEVYKLLKKEITPNTIIIVSSDLSHFLNEKQAVKRDELTIKNILENKKDIDACGEIGIKTLNLYALENDLNKKLLKYTNSSETTKDYQSVVGYSSFVYYEKDDEDILLKISKKVIQDKLLNKKTPINDLKETIPKKYFENKSVFVTVYLEDELRGCIGEIYPNKKSIFENVVTNAVQAGFQDPRFPSLTINEFEKINIEISILSEPKKVLLEDIKKNDGVIISKGFNKAVYLPQVWNEIENKEYFLGSLCEKAGLDFNCFKNKNVNFETFEVEIIS